MIVPDPSACPPWVGWVIFTTPGPACWTTLIESSSTVGTTPDAEAPELTLAEAEGAGFALADGDGLALGLASTAGLALTLALAFAAGGVLEGGAAGGASWLQADSPMLRRR